MSKILLFIMLLTSSPIFAVEAGFGLFAVEESDDRLRPGLNASISVGRYEANLYSYARSFGPVFEHSVLLSVANKFAVPIFRQLFGSLGLALLTERTTLRFSPRDQGFNADDEQYNFGAYLSLKWERRIGRRWLWRVSWDAAIFPAGATGGLLLATGRKQFFTFATGYQL